MKRALFALVLVAVAAVALGDAPAQGLYDGMLTPENTGFTFTTADGPPRTLTCSILSGPLTYHEDTGVYTNSAGDGAWFANGVAHFVKQTFPPNAGVSGPYWPSH